MESPDIRLLGGDRPSALAAACKQPGYLTCGLMGAIRGGIITRPGSQWEVSKNSRMGGRSKKMC